MITYFLAEYVLPILMSLIKSHIRLCSTSLYFSFHYRCFYCMHVFLPLLFMKHLIYFNTPHLLEEWL